MSSSPTRLLPHSLLWRAFLLIATLMLAAVGAWLAIFRQAEIEPRAHALAQTIVSISNLTRTALLAARPERRIDVLADLSDVEGVHVYPAEADDRIVPPPATALMRHLESDLRERLGTETRLAFELNDEPGLFVSFRLFPGEDGVFWLALPRERLEGRFPLQWLGWGALVLLLALAGAWLIVLRISRPLKALEAAAGKLGQGETPSPLPEKGPDEIVAVTHAFNQMSESLKRLEEDRRLLLAGISHDLRTPLARLRMEIEISVSDPQARADMAADIDEMDRTIGQFLDFARHKAQRSVALEPTNLAPWLGEIAARYGDKVKCRPASAEFLHPIQREPLRRAVVNLIENALRHGGGTAAVELTLEREDGRLVIAVLDRGPGIAPEDAERLKQPFTRGEAARTGAAGAGLGLAIVERIARAHGGRLELLPREGGGLAARIVLPVN
ncbi:ATP-binding protein [Sulfuricystis multivorans]|uniref:ATP-binding protein n=1 Tax=Sulfuricystis multivorans TaxID=2211108 RepID=UPI000F849CBA|nr:ATP-binding protein [Sulfuricystis multivorans]